MDREQMEAQLNLMDGKDLELLISTVQERLEFVPDESLDIEVLKKNIYATLWKLPKKLRLTMLMRYFQEMSVSEIARIQNVSEGAVKETLHAGRDVVKKCLVEYERRYDIEFPCAGVVPVLLWFFKESRMEHDMFRKEVEKAIKMKQIKRSIVKKTPIVLKYGAIAILVLRILVGIKEYQDMKAENQSAENEMNLTTDDTTQNVEDSTQNMDGTNSSTEGEGIIEEIELSEEEIEQIKMEYDAQFLEAELKGNSYWDGYDGSHFDERMLSTIMGDFDAYSVIEKETVIDEHYRNRLGIKDMSKFERVVTIYCMPPDELYYASLFKVHNPEEIDSIIAEVKKNINPEKWAWYTDESNNKISYFKDVTVEEISFYVKENYILLYYADQKLIDNKSKLSAEEINRNLDIILWLRDKNLKQ